VVVQGLFASVCGLIEDCNVIFSIVNRSLAFQPKIIWVPSGYFRMVILDNCEMEAFVLSVEELFGHFENG
jgi:hypothetical protein